MLTIKRAVLLLLVLVLAISISTPVEAQRHRSTDLLIARDFQHEGFRVYTPPGQLQRQAYAALSMEILVDGRPLPKIISGNKTYVVAPSGKDYELWFGCQGAGRYLAVAYVDGLSILTGKPPLPGDTGYVIEQPGSTISGFKLNDSSIARFHFGKRRDSYAALTARPQEIGKITVTYYADATPRVVVAADRPTSVRGTLFSRVSRDMGTEFGRRADAQSRSTAFTRGAQVCSMTIDYASEDSLKRSGIIKNDRSAGSVKRGKPPLSSGGGQGAKPPPGWKG